MLFPEAFGLLALLMVFITGVSLLSDVGVGPSIQQSKRGDDPAFVDTAWTIQIIRGVILWGVCCFLAPIAGYIYDSQLQAMLPVAGLALVVSGFNPTRIETAYRHLTVGLLTRLELLVQVLSLTLNIILVFMMKSAWALVLGYVGAAVIRLIILHLLLPGLRNRLRWEQSSVHELVGFGKWIFLSTLCTFLLTQCDKIVLGIYMSLDMLGIYNIGFTLASFGVGLMSMITSRVMIPTYRERPPGASLENFRAVRLARILMTSSALVLQFAIGIGGMWLVDILYDPRFAAAGSVVVAVACMNVPYIIGLTYDQAALAAGDSRGLFLIMLFRALAQTSLFLAGGLIAGLAGAVIGVWVGQLLGHISVIWLARRHRAWDGLHDAVFFSIGLVATAVVLEVNRDVLQMLQTFWGSGAA